MSPKNIVYIFMCWLFMLNCYVSAKKCLRNGLYEHPTDCKKYYSCAPFGPIMMHCPGGLHFNPTLFVCDWPQNAGCRSETVDRERDCPIYPHPHDCTKFYSCAPSGRILMNCPEGLHFNPQLLVCDWPRNVECLNKLAPSTTHPEDTTVSSTEALMEPAGDEKYSTALRDETSTKFHLEPETYFYTSHDSEELLTTSTDPSLTTTYVASTSQQSVDSNNIETCSNTIWPHPTDCRKFLMASLAGNIEISCPNGLLFNSILLVCDLESNVECPKLGTTTELFTSQNSPTDIKETTLITTNTDSIDSSEHNCESNSDTYKTTISYSTTPLSNSDYSETTNSESTNSLEICKGSLWPHPTDCAKFFMCSSTGPVEIVCSGELLFNPTLLVCDWPVNFECYENPQKTTTGSNESITLVSTTEEMKHYSSETSMTSDIPISTSTGEVTTIRYEEFDSTISNIVTTEDVSTSNFATIDSDVSATEPGETTRFSQEASSTMLTVESTRSQLCKSGLWPHPTDCSKFFMCGSTGPVEVLCPEDLLFNPILLLCDWPKNVECYGESAVSTDDYVSTTDTYPVSSSDRGITVQAYGEDTSTIIDKHSEQGIMETVATTAGSQEMFTTLATNGSEITESPELIADLVPSTVVNQNENSPNLTVESSHYIPTTVDAYTTIAARDRDITAQTNEEDVSTAVENDTERKMIDIAATTVTSQGIFTTWTTITTENYEEIESDRSTRESGQSTIFNHGKSSVTTMVELLTELDQSTVVSENESSVIPTQESLTNKQACRGSLWPHPTDCTKFFMCSSTGPVEIVCSGELLFNPTLLVCDWPVNFECYENPQKTTTESNEPTTLVSTTEEMEHSSSETSMTSDTSILTSTGEVTTIGYEEFDSTISSTATTKDVSILNFATTDSDVSATERGETTRFSQEASSTMFTVESTHSQLCKSGLWPHPTDCSKFFMCGSTGPVEVLCPEDLLFNPILLLCDWPKNVECYRGSAVSTVDYFSTTNDTYTMSSSDRGITAQAYEEDTSTIKDKDSEPGIMKTMATTIGSQETFTTLTTNYSEITESAELTAELVQSTVVNQNESLANPTIETSDYIPTTVDAYTTIASSDREITTQTNEEDVSTAVQNDTERKMIDNAAITVSSQGTSATLTTSYSEIATENYEEIESDRSTRESGQSTIFNHDKSSVTTMVELVTELDQSPGVSENESSIIPTQESLTNKQACRGSLWPHPTDCTKFFKCDSSGPVEFQCPDELRFNPSLLACDWPKNVICHEEPAVLTDFDSATDGTYTISLKDRDIKAQAYEEDVYNVTTVSSQKTSTTLTGSSEITTENYKETEPDRSTTELVLSTIIYQEGSSVISTEESSTKQICKGSLWPHPTDCSKFFRCDSSEPVEVQCPEELLFNPALLVCGVTKNVQCLGSPQIETLTPGADVDATNLDASTRRTAQSTFQKTTSDDDVAVDLREISIITSNYSEVTTQNDNKGGLNVTATIHQEENSTMSAETSSQGNNSEPCKGNLWPHPNDCTKYIQCGSTGPVEFKCPGNLLFNPTLLICDWPKDSGCIQSSTAENSIYLLNDELTKPDPSTISAINNVETATQSYGSNDSDLLSTNIEPGSSEAGGTSIGMQEHTAISALESNSFQSEPEDDALQETSTLSTIEPSIKKNNTHLCKGSIWPHPSDCSKFFTCGSTGPVEVQCSGELLFNPVWLICDWPQKTDCLSNATSFTFYDSISSNETTTINSDSATSSYASTLDDMSPLT